MFEVSATAGDTHLGGSTHAMFLVESPRLISVTMLPGNSSHHQAIHALVIILLWAGEDFDARVVQYLVGEPCALVNRHILQNCIMPI